MAHDRFKVEGNDITRTELALKAAGRLMAGVAEGDVKDRAATSLSMRQSDEARVFLDGYLAGLAWGMEAIMSGNLSMTEILHEEHRG